jgi:MFS family permease
VDADQPPGPAADMVAGSGAAPGAAPGVGTARTPGPAPVPLRRNRDFSLLWSGQAVSLLGTQMSVVAYPLLVLSATGSAAQAGIVGGATLIGSLVMLLPAGVVADHYPRKRILVITAVTQMIVVATVVPAALTHHVYLAHLASVGLIQGCASAFYLGASRGSIRRIVPAEQLPAAMSRTLARDQAAALAGPPAGGALFGLAQFLPFAADSASFGAIAAAAALIRARLDPDPAGDGAKREPVRHAVTRGVRFVFGQPYLRTVAIWATTINAVAAGMLLMVIVLARSKGATPVVIGGMMSVNAACGLAGALAAPRLNKLIGGRRMALTTSWLLPACAVGIAYAPSVWLIALLGALTTFTIMPVNVAFQARAARITPDHLQAQAGNAQQLFAISLSWMAPPVFGLLTDSIGARSAMLIAAGMYFCTAVWLQRSTELHGLDEQLTAGRAR